MKLTCPECDRHVATLNGFEPDAFHVTHLPDGGHEVRQITVDLGAQRRMIRLLPPTSEAKPA